MTAIKHDKKMKFQVPVKLYRIGEVVRYTPFTRQTIHNYTTMGLIQESDWTEGGHRLYDESVFERLATIMELRKTNTLTEIRKMMRHNVGRDPNRAAARKA
ncbi:MAG: MerR family transcriptional regulator [Phycisphaerae bacterium]|nr:MerR family transcriptional regulator [Phycisphaerae bacterium]